MDLGAKEGEQAAGMGMPRLSCVALSSTSSGSSGLPAPEGLPEPISALGVQEPWLLGLAFSSCFFFFLILMVGGAICFWLHMVKGGGP